MSAPTRSPSFLRLVIEATKPDAIGRPLIDAARRELAALTTTDTKDDITMTDHSEAEHDALFAQMFPGRAHTLDASERGVPDDGRVRVVEGKLDLSEIHARYTEAERDEILLAYKLGTSLTPEERAAGLVLAEHEEHKLALSDATARITNDLN